jgi:CheY-like chemotaxis protein
LEVAGTDSDIARRVLVVDDDPDWREFLRLSLEELGYVADEAPDGASALSFLQRQRYGVVLLDLNMPGMRGEEVARSMPARAPKVVFMTAAPVDQVGRAMSQGAHYYLPKGASREQLQLILQSLAAH